MSSEEAEADIAIGGGIGRRRSLISVLDQAASSLSNGALGFLVAHAANQATFGEFSLVIMSYAIMLGVSRTFFSEPYAVLGLSNENRKSSFSMIWVFGRRQALLSTSFLALTALLVLIVSGWQIQSLSLVLLVAFPLLALQDLLRLAAVSRGQASLALLSDGLWVLLFFSIVAGGAFLRGTPSALFVGVTWVATGVLALIPVGEGLRRNLKDADQVKPTPALLKRTTALGFPAASEYLILNGASLLSFFVGTWILTTSGIAGARGASLLQGPVTVVLMGISQALLPSFAARRDRGAGLVRPLQVGFMSFVVLAYSGLFLLPNSIGRIALGETWPATRGVLLPWGVFALSIAFSIPVVMFIRSAQAAKKLFQVRVFVAIPTLFLGIMGARISIEGFSWGMAIAQSIDAAVVFVVGLQLRRSLLRIDADR
jgi:hypothetical protein